MKKSISNFLEATKNHLNDSFFKNSYLLILYAISTSIFSFLFWIIVARNYNANDVGIAVAIISLCQMIATFSAFGLDIGIIRFYPLKDNKNELINFCFSMVGLLSLVLSIVCLLSLKFWAPALQFMSTNFELLLLFLVISLFSSMFNMQGRFFIASKNVNLSLYHTMIFNIIKLPVPLLLLSLGFIAIIFSWALALVIAVIIGLFWFIPKINLVYKPAFTLKKDLIKELIPFSFGNYIAGVFGSLPITIIPLVILSVLGPANAAFFYMAYSLGSILSFISNSVTTSLFVEGSYCMDEISKKIIESVKLIFIILIPAVIGLFLFGNELLLIMGKSYSQNAAVLLLLIGLSSFPYSIMQIYVTILRIDMNIKYLIAIYAFHSILLVVGSYVLLTIYGLIGVGISWILSYTIIALVLLIKFNLKRLARLA